MLPLREWIEGYDDDERKEVFIRRDIIAEQFGEWKVESMSDKMLKELVGIEWINCVSSCRPPVYPITPSALPAPLRARLRLRRRCTALGFTPVLMCPPIVPMTSPGRCAARCARTSTSLGGGAISRFLLVFGSLISTTTSR